MKTQLSNPSRSKARYTEEYKKEALELWRNSGRSAAKVAAEVRSNQCNPTLTLSTFDATTPSATMILVKLHAPELEQAPKLCARL